MKKDDEFSVQTLRMPIPCNIKGKQKCSVLLLSSPKMKKDEVLLLIFLKSNTG